MLANLKFKKVISWCLIFVLSFSFLGSYPITANASTNDNNIVNGGKVLYFDAEGQPATEADYAVKMSKMLTATEQENKYNVTLNVDVKDQIVETEKTTGADIVLVFDASTSMDVDMLNNIQPGSRGWTLGGTRWSFLKTAATEFIQQMLPQGNTTNKIAIVVYGGTNSSNLTDKAFQQTICNWTTDAATAIASFSGFETVSQSTIDYLPGGAKENQSLRKSAFGDRSTDYGATNCQAGFRGANAELNKVADSTNLPYVVYLSDGDANRAYTIYKGNPIITSGDNDYEYSLTGGKAYKSSAQAVPAAKAQAADILQNHPIAKILTIAFGTSNEVLDPVTNPAIEAKYDANNAGDLQIAYGSIKEQIVREANPWMVYDPMSEYVTFDQNSIASESFATFEAANNRLVWDVAAESAAAKVAGTPTQHFDLTYTVNLKMDNLNVWANNATHPTNGQTDLVYKVIDVIDGVDVPHQANTVQFDIPTVKANLYTYTVRHFIDDVQYSTDENLTLAAGSEINLAAKQLAIPNASFVKNTFEPNIDVVDGKVIAGAATDKAVINYYYNTGYPLTINYVEKEDYNHDGNTVLAPQHSQSYKNGSEYQVTSPVIDGYQLVVDTQNIIQGTIDGTGVTATVTYELTNYGVTYEYSGTAPQVDVPKDNTQYNLYNNTVTVAAAPEVAGWTFNGWKIDGAGTTYQAGTTFTATAATKLVGTWSQNAYDLDVVYIFDGTAKTDHDNAVNAAGEQARIAAEAEINLDTIKLELATVAAKADYAQYVKDFVPEFASNGPDGLPNTEDDIYTVVETEDVWVAAKLTEDYIATFTADAQAAKAVKVEEAVNAAMAKFDTDLAAALGVEMQANYTSADGTEFTNAYVTETAVKHYNDSYSVTAKSLSGYQVTPQNNTVTAGQITADTTVVFLISNDLYTVKVNHYLAKRGGGYELKATVGFSLNENAAYSVAAQNFTGFAYAPAATDVVGDYTMGTADKVYDLYYNAQTYNATFEFIGVTPPDVQTPAAQSDLWYGEQVINPNTAQSGWVFDGWYADKNCTQAYNFSTPVTADVQLFGKWNRVTYKVDFNFIGNPPADAQQLPAEQIVNDGEKATNPNYTYTDTTPLSYQFDGWYTNSDCSGEKYDFNATVNANQKLFGKWTSEYREYFYFVEHYYVGAAEPFQIDKNDLFRAVYGYQFTDAAAATLQVTSGLAPYNEFKSATGVTISENTADNVIKCYYGPQEFKLTINYVFPDQQTAAPTYEGTYAYDQDYGVASPDLLIDGKTYKADVAVVSGKMPGEDLIVKVTYVYVPPTTPDTPGNDYYSVTVEYLELDTNKTLQDAYTTREIAGNQYDVTKQTQLNILGYEIAKVSGDAASGKLNADKDLTVYYKAINNNPGTPDNPGNPPSETEIPEENPPLTETPNDHNDGGNNSGANNANNEEDIFDEDTPLAASPATGDNNLMAVMFLVALAAASLTVCTIKGMKKEDC